MGYLYQHGLGVPQDCPKAMELYLKATNQRDKVSPASITTSVIPEYTNAKNNIGDLYQHGHGVPQNYSKAMSFEGFH
ncbi:hypothetical protein BGZ76_005191, partial [Entomortierella beljakovae]